MPPAAAGENAVEMGRYPLALASHEDVVVDPTLFWDTLRKFHSQLGTKYVVPVIGGKDLDLHILYVEVTKRGGFDKVVSDKKWREISSIFNFSPTTTSASYALRKHYFGLLHHYEQVYFFKRQAPQTLQATGTIEQKFDCGYMVTVPVGDEVLNGVLYFPDQPTSSNNRPITQPCNAMVQYGPAAVDPTVGRNRRRRRKRGGDPSRPKPNRSGYNFYFSEKHAELKGLYPEREREFTKMIGESWNSLSQEEKVVYQQKGVADKERYQKELKEYKDRIMLGQQNRS